MRQDALQREPDARLEVTRRTPLLVEPHQVGEIFTRHRAAIRLLRQRLQDVGRTRLLFGDARRPAREDTAAAGRIGDAGDDVRADDGELAQVRKTGDAVGLADVRVGERVFDRMNDVVDRTVRHLDERGGDALRAGLHVDRRRRHVEPVRIGLAHQVIDRKQRRARAVDRHFNLLAARGAAEEVAGGPAVQQHLEDVFAVGREVVHDRDAAAGPDGCAVDAAHLRRGAGDVINLRARRRVAVADRQAADLARRPQVAFHQRRGERLLVGNIVEAVADRVWRQERVDVHLDRQQVLHGAGVFRAIQTLEWTMARIRIRRGHFVDARLERGHERRHRRLVRALHAGGRHHARPQLPDHLFGNGWRLLGMGRVVVGERQPAHLHPIVMARGAVLLDERAFRIRCCGVPRCSFGFPRRRFRVPRSGFRVRLREGHRSDKRPEQGQDPMGLPAAHRRTDSSRATVRQRSAEEEYRASAGGL